MEQWGGLFVEGEYPERKNDKGEVTAPAKSKNVMQNKIKSAVNFIGSPIHTLLVAGGAKIDLPAVGEDMDDSTEGNEQGAASTPAPEAQSSGKTSHSNDALGGIV